MKIVTVLPALRALENFEFLSFLQKIIAYAAQDPQLLKTIDFHHLIYLTILGHTYFRKLKNSKVHATLMTQRIASRITHIKHAICVLPVLLNFKIVSADVINALTSLDHISRTQLNTTELVYYMITYNFLYNSTKRYNAIVFDKLKFFDTLLERYYQKLSILEKCQIILHTKSFTSNTKNNLVVKPVLDKLEELPSHLFAGVVNNAMNLCYSLINKEKLLFEVRRRLNGLDHKELVLIGKALAWQEIVDEKFWRRFFGKMNYIFKDHFMKNTIWVCDFYQLIYSLKALDVNFEPEHYNQIKFKEIEKMYFERPNLPTFEEFTRSEFELGQVLTGLGLEHEVQIMIGIYRVDFLIKPNFIVELYGRHHFTERNVLNASTASREKQLTKLGYHVIGIVLQDWNDMNSDEKRTEYLKRRLQEKNFDFEEARRLAEEEKERKKEADEEDDDDE